MKKIIASSHELFGMTMLIAFINPALGYVIGIIYLAKDDRLDRKLGIALIYGSMLATLFYTAAIFAFINLVPFKL